MIELSLESDCGQNPSFASPRLFMDIGEINGKDIVDSVDCMLRESESGRYWVKVSASIPMSK